MTIAARLFVSAGVAVAMAGSASAQSLGQIAKQEEIRRAAVKQPVRTFTNDDLGPLPITSAPAADAAAEGCYQSISSGECLTAEEMIAASDAKINGEARDRQEATWRKRAGELRSRLEKQREEASVLAAAAADQRRSPAERATAARALSMKELAIADQEGRWAKFEAQADTDRIPRQWIAPIPTIATRTPR